MAQGNGKCGGAGSWVTCVACLFHVASLAFAATFLSIGFGYLHDCPLQHLIPVFLIVHGFGALIGMVMGIMFWNHYGSYQQPSMSLRVIRGLLLYFFHGAWEIAGSVWVFSAAREQANATERTAPCDSVVYNTALVHVIVVYVLWGLYILYKLYRWFRRGSDSENN